MRRLRKWLLRAALALGVLLLLLLAVYAARRPLFEATVIDRVQTAAGDLLGGRWQIESIGGNWLTGVELRGVNLQGGEVVAEITGGEADVAFDLWQLVRGDLSGVRQGQVRADRLLVVIPQQASAGEASHGPPFDPRELFPLLPDGADVRIDDFELRGVDDAALRGPLRLSAAARSPGAELLAELSAPGVTAQIALERSGQLRVRASADAAEQIARLVTVVPEGTRGQVQLQATVRLAPEFEVRVEGSVTAAAAAGHAIRELGWQASLHGQQLEVQKMWGRATDASFDIGGFRADLGDPAGGSGTAKLSFAGLRPYLELLPAGLDELADLTGSVNATLRDGALHLEPSSFELPGINVQVTKGTLPLRGGPLAGQAAAEPPAGASLSFLVEVDEPPAELLAKDLPVRPVSGTVRGELSEGAGVWRVAVDSDLGLRDSDGRLGNLSGQLAVVFGEALELSPDLVVSGALLRGAPPLRVAGRATIADGIGLDPVSLQVGDAGSLVVRGTIANAADFDQILRQSSLDVRADAFGLRPLLAVLGLPDALAGTLHGAARLSDQATATSALRVEFEQLPAVGPAVASLVLDATDTGLLMRDFELTSAGLSVRASGEMPGVSLPQLVAEPERCLRTAFTGTAHMQVAQLEQLTLAGDAATVGGALVADLSVTGTLERPAVTLQFDGRDAHLLVDGMRVKQPVGKFRLADDVLTIEDLAVQLDEITTRLAGKIERGPESLRGELTGTLAGLPVGSEPIAFDLQIVGDGERLAVERLHAGNAAIEVDGSAALLLATLEDLFTQPDKLLGHELQANVRVVAADITTLAAGQHGSSGRVTATLAVAGTLAEPVPTLEVLFEGGSVRIPEGPRIDDMRGRLRVTANEVSTEQLTATVAGGTLRMHGTYRSPEPLLREWRGGQLNLAVEGKDVLLRRKDGVRIRADLDVSAIGKLEQIDVKGTVRPHSSKIVRRIPFFAFGEAGGAAVQRGMVLEGPDLGEGIGINLDLLVASDEPIQVETNVVAGDVMTALSVRGTLRAPRLEGTLAMPTGKIILPGCQFRATNARLQFLRGDPYFPTLAISAQGRRHGYDIRMTVSGPYDQPEIVLTSTPPLAPEQLVVLVATGARPDALVGGRAVGAVLGSYLVEELADNLFGSESTEAKEGFVSRFNVETGTEISANGTESVVIQFRVFDNVFLEGERDVYEDVNLGVVYRIRFK